MTSFLRPFVFLLLATALGAGSLSAQAFVQGVVRNSDGARLAGMTVAAYNTAGGNPTETTTGSDGRYMLGLPPATYRVLAYDPNGGFATSFFNEASSFETSAEITVAPGSTQSGVDFRLQPAVKIHGVVRTARGELLDQMVVSAYNLDGTRRGHQKSASDGSYVMALPRGQYKLAAWDDALVFAPEFYDNASSFSTASTVSAETNLFGIDFSLALGARVSGKAVAEENAQALPGVVVAAYDVVSGSVVTTATTQPPLGAFEMSLPPGRYKFGATDPGGLWLPEFYSNAPSFAAAASFELLSGSTRSDVDFSLAPKSEPPAPSTLFVPGVVNSPGAEESYWRTDAWLYNPSQETLSIEAVYLAANGASAPLTITVAPRGQVEIRNIVESLFGASGLGALRLTAPRPFAAVSRTFNTPKSGVGTFGFSIPALHPSTSLGLAVLQGLAHGGDYRTNVGIMNPHDHALNVHARLFSAANQLLGETTFTIAPLTIQQPSLAGILPAGSTLTNGYVVLSAQDGSFFSFASVVDNASNDPTLVMPTADEPQN